MLVFLETLRFIELFPKIFMDDLCTNRIKLF